MNDDTELLRRFADEGAQDAFAELVRRKVNLVYAAALRQTGGDAHLAEDVTQGVFLALACRAGALKRHAVLTGWLYTTTRFVAAKAVRTQARWQRREQEANTMSMHAPESPAAWTELRPVLDEAMHELGEKERDAVLLRFFEGQPFAAVGATLGLTENAARMRVDRALEKLRERLARRGITSTAAALGAALAAQPVIAAPAGLAANVAGAALAAGVASSSSVFGLLMSTKLKVGVLGALVATGVGAFFIGQRRTDARLFDARSEAVRQAREIAALRLENDRLRQAPLRAQTAPVTPAPAATRPAVPLTKTDSQAELVAQQRREILQNLRQLAKAREQFVMENGRPPASLADLVGPTKYVWKLSPVAGEDYSRLQFDEGKPFSVTTAGGVTITVVTNSLDAKGRLIPGTGGGMAAAPSTELLAAITTAVDAYRLKHQGENPPLQDWAKILPYFETPKEAADYVDWVETGAEMGARR